MTVPVPPPEPPLLPSLTAADMAPLLPDAPQELLAVVIEDVQNYALAEVPELLLARLNEGQRARVKSILRVAVKRYVDAGDGTVVRQEAPGGYAQSNDATGLRRGGILYRRELETLAKIAGVTRSAGDQSAIVLGVGAGHVPWCATTWGAACDCPTANPWQVVGP